MFDDEKIRNILWWEVRVIIFFCHNIGKNIRIQTCIISICLYAKHFIGRRKKIPRRLAMTKTDNPPDLILPYKHHVNEMPTL